MYDFETIPSSPIDAVPSWDGWMPAATVTRPRPMPLRETTGSEPSSETAPVAGDAYREAMARLASAVHVVTTDGPGGRAGFTASAVCSVSDAPPTLLVCLNRGSSSHPVFGRNGLLCVNTLSADQQAVAKAFGGGTPMEARFAASTWTRLKTGAPVLAGSLLAFDCRIVERSAVATHDVLFCEVLALRGPSEAASLLYAGRRYHALAHVPPHAPSHVAPGEPARRG